MSEGTEIPVEERIFKPAKDGIHGFHTITLEKVAEGSEPVSRPHKPWLPRRKARVGELFTYTYKSLDRKQAIQRASQALVREFPDENRMNWKELK